MPRGFSARGEVSQRVRSPAKLELVYVGSADGVAWTRGSGPDVNADSVGRGINSGGGGEGGRY